MKIVGLMALAGGLAALSAAGGCHRPEAGAAPAGPTASLGEPAAGAVERVTAGRPTRKTLELLTTQPGRIEAYERTPLVAKLAGYVRAVAFDIGDPVREGDVLIELAIPELHDDLAEKEALVGQAAAEIRQAEAALTASRAAMATARARVAQARAGIGRAEGEADRWRAESERIDALVSRGSVSPKLAEEARNQSRSGAAARQEALAGVEAAEAAVAEAEANVARAEANRVAAEARSRVADAEVARARSLLTYTKIAAPFDGVVTARAVDTGHYVSPTSAGAGPPLMVVARQDRFRVVVDVPELEAARVTAGPTPDTAVVRVQALPGREFPATVTRTGWALDAANRSLRVELELPGDERLRPGLYANVAILLERREDVLTLPATALVPEGDRTFCCRVAGGTVERVPVTTGLRVGADVEIVDGLTGEETVVLARAGSLRDRQQVEVIPSGP